MAKTEGLKFQHLEVENFKGIEKRVVNINGRSLLITGKNDRTKSSLIQALLSGINPKVQPTETIKKGETKASTKVKIAGILNGNEEEYEIEMYYTPANQSGRLVLTNSKGEKVKSPSTVLKSLIGDISFDIYKFLNAKKVDQIKVLKQLSGVELEINKLDADRKKHFDERTLLAHTIKESESVMNNHGFTPEQIELYSKEIDMIPLNEALNTISKKVDSWNGVKTKTEQYKKDSDTDLSDIDKNEKEILELEAKIKALKDKNVLLEQHSKDCLANVEKGKVWLEKNPEPKAEAATKEITDATLHNNNHEKVNLLAEKQRKLIKDKQDLEALNKKIDDIDKKKDKVIKNSKLPIDGLTFTDENIFLHGLPMEVGQINTAKLLEVGVEISMALNPNLRTIFLHEGSLLDSEALAALIRKVEERGYQLIAEIVTDENEVDIKFTEEEA